MEYGVFGSKFGLNFEDKLREVVIKPCCCGGSLVRFVSPDVALLIGGNGYGIMN